MAPNTASSPSSPPSGPVVQTRYTMRDLLTVVFYEKRMILIFFFFIVSLGVGVAFMLGKTYTASTRILVLPSQEYVMKASVGTIAQGLAMEDKAIVRSEMQILDNDRLIEEVIQDMSLARIYPKIAVQPVEKASSVEEANRIRLGMAVTAFRTRLDVQTVKDANVIGITYTHVDGGIAAEALNLLVMAYMEYRRSVFAQPKADIFVNQRDIFAGRLTTLEKKAEKLKEENNISDFTAQKSLILRQHAEMLSNQLETNTLYDQTVRRLAQVESELAKTPKVIPIFSDSNQDDSRDTARSTLVTLEMRRNELLTRFTEDNRYVLDLDTQIQDMKNLITATPPKESRSERVGPNPLHQQLNAEVATLKSEAESLRARRTSVNGQIESISDRLTQFDNLERLFNSMKLEREVLQQNLLVYSQKVEESRITKAMEDQKTANVRVIEEATPPRKANNPTRIILILSGILGVIFAGGSAFIKDFFREIMISPENAERVLGLPVLVAVPVKGALVPVEADEPRRKKKRRKAKK
ncbi:MAG: hypothetical protein HQL50_00380 [Magnetococcales bacterium]|nr:hypothetical protein [Magnetococcales bacterium]